MSTGTAADDQFYREYILDHYKNPRNFGRLEDPDISHEEDNPLCGDVIGMDFRIKDGVIDDIRFHGRGCAISQASASRWTERLKGLPLEDATKVGMAPGLKGLSPPTIRSAAEASLTRLRVERLDLYYAPR